MTTTYILYGRPKECHLRNTFDFWNVHEIMKTSGILQSTVRCQIKVHKVNFKAKNTANFQHL